MFFKKKIIWHKLFDSAEEIISSMPLNKPLQYFVANKKVCVVNTGKELKVVDDNCPHNGASLSMGKCGDDGTIICPVHRYAFDLNTGHARSGLGERLNTYPVEIKNKAVYVGFEKTVFDLL